MKKYGRTILIGVILVTAVFQLSIVTQEAKADSWTQITQTDFEDGERSFVEIESSPGDVKIQPVYDLPWTRTGQNANDFFGYSVSSAGDVNGDGYSDVIVGAPYYDTGSWADAGKAYMYLGGPTGLSTTPVWTSSGDDDQSTAYYGYTVSYAGDVNADGYDDWIVGAPFYDSSKPNAGKAYLYLGSSDVSGTTATWTSSGDDQSGAKFGNSVSSAGDVNRDGYDDWIVGAVEHDTSTSNSGKAYLYLGSASVSGTTASWTSSGDDHVDRLYGISVSGAGDVNGDDYDDWIVGASDYDTTNDRAGKAYLYLGSSDVSGTTATWTSSGDDQAVAHYGGSVSNAGDVNADDYDDWIVGAPDYDSSNTNAGKAYLYLGSSDVSGITATWTSSGDDQANARYGTSVSSAGDVNSDGYDDLIVGARCYDISTSSTDTGKVYLYTGTISGLIHSPSWTSSGDKQTDAEFGNFVSNAGDVNMDGYDDIIIGALYFDTSNQNTGKVYVYRLMYHSVPIYDSCYPHQIWTSSGDGQASADYGFSVSNAGDVNGDGYDDVIVGSPTYDTESYSIAGKAYLYLGSANGLSSLSSWTSSGDNNQEAPYYGLSVSGAGDVNCDGYDDVIVGAPGYDTTNIDAGKAYLYLGGPTGLLPNPAWTSSGDDQAGAIYGEFVSSAGDVNGDGYDDVIVGAARHDTSNTDAGKAYLYLGSAIGLSKTPEWTSSGDDDQSNVDYGRSVSNAGDVNGDGYDDWIVGAPYYDTSNFNAGKAYLYLGSSDVSGTTATWTSSGDDQSSAYYSYSVSTAGDVNGDGYDDWVVGAFFYDTPGPKNNAGKVYLYLGRSSNVAGITDSWTSSGDDQADAEYGRSVSNAGDVNGDDYDDWIVGAPEYDSSNTNAGKAYLYLGSSDVSGITATWTSSGDDHSGAEFGNSVSSAGDVNRDGYDEVIIGATLIDKAYLYQIRYFQQGIYTSPILDADITTPTVWHSISWEPRTQPEGTSLSFQIATSDDANADTWEFLGPDGTTNTYYTHTRGEEIWFDHHGRYLRFRAYLSSEEAILTPVLSEVTVYFGKEFPLSIELTSPNGGELFFDGDMVPIIWTATGNLGPNPITITYTFEGVGGSLQGLVADTENDGIHYWTVPKPIQGSQAHAIISVMVTDLDGNTAYDTCDVSFAIDPPLQNTDIPQDDDSFMLDDTTSGGEDSGLQPLHLGLIGLSVILASIATITLWKSVNKKRNNKSE